MIYISISKRTYDWVTYYISTPPSSEGCLSPWHPPLLRSLSSQSSSMRFLLAIPSTASIHCPQGLPPVTHLPTVAPLPNGILPTQLLIKTGNSDTSSTHALISASDVQQKKIIRLHGCPHLQPPIADSPVLETVCKANSIRILKDFSPPARRSSTASHLDRTTY